MEAFVRERMLEESSAGAEAERFLEEAGGMTLFGTIGASYHLRPDGSVWVNEWVPDSPNVDEWRWRKASPQEAIGAIKVAAKRLTRLAQLIPEPTPSTLPCAGCGGTGRLTQAGQGIEGVWCPSCYGVGFPIAGAT
jgi:hypothetical protein